MRILLVEDDRSLGESIRGWLLLDGYVVDWVERGDQALVALAGQQYQCMLLDRGLPGLDGDSVLERVRSQGSGMPILFITAWDQIRDRVDGLDRGADDYLVKPFDLEELSARIRLAIRRAAQQPAERLRHGTLELDVAGKRTWKDGQEVALTAREFAVLHALMLRPGNIVSRDRLEDLLYGWTEEVESNTIEVHVYHLRRKLGGERIQTVRYQGYRMAAAA